MSTRRGFLQTVLGSIAATLVSPLSAIFPVQCGVMVSNRWTGSTWDTKLCGRSASQSRLVRWGNRMLGENFDRFSTQWRCPEHARMVGWN